LRHPEQTAKISSNERKKKSDWQYSFPQYLL
jgi:hypothetical protein